MSSLAQINANQRNAKLSTGPRTESGKRTVSANAARHGLAGAHLILPGENAVDYDSLLQSLRDDLNPAGPTESFLVREMAQSQWKLMRIAGMEVELLHPNPDLVRQAPEASPSQLLADQALLKLSRYEAAARRAYHQALKQLLSLQATRRKLRQDEQKAAGQKRQPVPAQSDTPNYETKPISAPPVAETAIPEPSLAMNG